MRAVQRLGQNLGGYRGERIDIQAVLRDVAGAAQRHGWRITELPVLPGCHLLTLQRPAPAAAAAGRRLYISTGIHGDEPAGPLAVRQLLQENGWPADADLWICPCLNPPGFERNTRENAAGVDLNRDYRDPKTAEVQAHVRWLERQPQFDFALCLHEDWEAQGFYVYEINPDGRESLAPRVIAAAAQVCPIDPSPEIDGWPARDGLIAPNVDPRTRPLWAEAVYLAQARTRYTCTLEAPSDFPLATRVTALVAGVRAALA